MPAPRAGTRTRIAGRLVTGPVAFLVAGVIDVSAFVLVSTLHRIFQGIRAFLRP